MGISSEKLPTLFENVGRITAPIIIVYDLVLVLFYLEVKEGAYYAGLASGVGLGVGLAFNHVAYKFVDSKSKLKYTIMGVPFPAIILENGDDFPDTGIFLNPLYFFFLVNAVYLTTQLIISSSFAFFLTLILFLLILKLADRFSFDKG